MRKLAIFSITVLLLVVSSVADARLVPSQKAWVGQDLHLAGDKLLSYQLTTGEHVLVFQNGFSMSIGANQFSSNCAVVWLESLTTEFRGRVHIDLKGQVYLQGEVLVERGRGAKMADLELFDLRFPADKQKAAIVRFALTGEIFVSADKRELGDPRGLELYQKAKTCADAVAAEPILRPAFRRAVEADVLVPKAPRRKPAIVARVARPKVKEPGIRYPVNIAPAGEVAPEIVSTKAADGTGITTVIGRFYLWQKQDEKGGLLELQADNAVIWRGQGLESREGPQTQKSALGGGDVRVVYLAGNVVMTEGQRTIRADEIYYDFQRKKALAVNAVMRNFDVSRQIPIYVRAAKLRQLAENKFAAEDITLTSSEFYQPQISLSASSVLITDTTTIDEQSGKVSDSSYGAQMRDVRLKVDDRTIFYWPLMRSNLQRPDVPLKGIHAGYDSTWGPSVETRWYLARLLGLPEPGGGESTFALDYYGKRGLGTGVEIDYEAENYFGKLLGYLISDTGKDKLGRDRTRRDLEPPRKLRGRFRWLHRQFLPYNWQLTTETGYASDERFIESYYRNEFNTAAGQETYIHLRRIEDNWAVSLLGKGRINDFADQLEEGPSAEYHLVGKSLFGDRFTFYSRSEIGRLRQRIGNEHSTAIDEEWFSFISHRTELDMPVSAGPFKVVPFLASTSGYDDRSGFRRSLVDGSNTGSFGEDKVWFGEAGLRLSGQYWKEYRDVKSQLWDINSLRHIISPSLMAVVYEESDSVVEQRDVLNIGLSQRLQTKRGPASEQRTVDWMRLDMDVTWVKDSEDASGAGPDRFIWNRPAVPLRVLSAPGIFGGDLEDTSFNRFEMFGPRRNYLGADYIWRLSDTSTLLSDFNFDMQSGYMQQFNVGLSHLRWPDLKFYIGSRYLRRLEVAGEKGSNAFVFAATYALDPRYTVVFSQQFDFDYGANIRNDIALIRRYHRIYCGLSFSADGSLSEQAIVFSIWPQGVPELAIGPRRYIGLGGYD